MLEYVDSKTNNLASIHLGMIPQAYPICFATSDGMQYMRHTLLIILIQSNYLQIAM